MNASERDPQRLLDRFGLNSFRPGQLDVIEAVRRGSDVMCVMPTGGGKSLCYQLPSLARDGTTIVISPLIALMKDQVDGLCRLGIAARLINSSLSLREQEDVMEEMASGALDLIYVAPERLRNGRFLEKLRQTRVTLLAVDEAHCVSEWGHDFRPDYARLGHVRQQYLGNLQTIALTATATPTVRADVCQLLGLREPKIFVTGFARTNLSFSVSQSKTESEKDEQLCNYVKSQSGSGIVYVATRKSCELIGHWLPEQTRRPIGIYHGGMEAEHRRVVQEKFMSGELDAIVATNAFGMGIDKADIRFVAHYNMPGTLEAYYQEAGRAGRDGLESSCRLFFSYQDRYIQEFFIENRYPSRETVQKVYEYLLSRCEDPIELTLDQVRQAIGADSSEAIGTAETLLAKAGVLRRLDSSQNQLLVRIDSDAPSMLDFLPKEAKLRRRVMSAVQRVIGNRRGDDVYVRPARLMELAEIDRDKLMRTLRELSRLNTFDYVPPFRGRAIHFTQREIPFENLEIDFDELARRKAAEYEKLESVIGFARSGGCRQRVILDYFGDPNSKNCTKCDRCEAASGDDDNNAPVCEGLTEADSNALLCGIRVILSGITRMHGRFGKNLVAQMLCGSQNKKITQWKLQRLSTYGMLSNMKQSQLTSVIDALIEHGMVEQREVGQRRPTIEITEQGKSVMHLKTSLPMSFRLSKMLARSLAAAARHIESSDVSTSHQSAGEADPAQALPDYSAEARHTEVDSEPLAGGVTVSLDDLTSPEQKLIQELTDSLKRWRRRTSAALGLPAYRVLSNSTLDRLAQTRPQTSSELELVAGIGPATMEQHGYDILELIRSIPEGNIPEGNIPEGSDFDRGESDAANDRTSNDKAAKDPSGDLDSTIAADSGKVDSGPDSASEGSARAQPARQVADLVHPPPNEVSQRDAYWTWRLFNDGFTLDEVCQIRKLNRAEIGVHLRVAEHSGRSVSKTWQE